MHKWKLCICMHHLMRDEFAPKLTLLLKKNWVCLVPRSNIIYLNNKIYPESSIVCHVSAIPQNKLGVSVENIVACHQHELNNCCKSQSYYTVVFKSLFYQIIALYVPLGINFSIFFPYHSHLYWTFHEITKFYGDIYFLNLVADRYE